MALSVVFALTATSCEKLSEDEIIAALEGGVTPDPKPGEWPKPTKDGVIQTSGLVDLGLSVKWAACNLSKTTASHLTGNCKELGSGFDWAVSSISMPPREIGGTAFDNATQLLGANWKTPSRSELMELVNRCRISYTIYEDAVGFVITGKANKAIFLPMTSYWTSSIFYQTYLGEEKSCCYYFAPLVDGKFENNRGYYLPTSTRLSIRPVYDASLAEQ